MDAERPEHQGDLQRQSCVRGGLFASRPAPPVDGHLNVRGKYPDEDRSRREAAQSAGRRAGDGDRAGQLGDAAHVCPRAWREGQRVGHDLVEEFGLHEVRDAGGTEERSEAEGGLVGTSHGSCCQSQAQGIGPGGWGASST